MEIIEKERKSATGWESLKTQLVDYDSEVLMHRRDVSINRLNRRNSPVPNQEEWKYSKIARWIKKNYTPQRTNEKLDLAEFHIPDLEANVLVFVNGYFRMDLSDVSHHQNGVVVQNLTEAIDLFSDDFEKHLNQNLDHTYFSDLNAAIHQNGVFIKVDSNTVVEHPIHMIYIQHGKSALSNPRNLVLIGDNARLDVMESQVEVAASECLSNQVTEWVIGKNATLNVTLFQQGKNNALINYNAFTQLKDSRLNAFTFSLEKAFIRNNHFVYISGSNTETRLQGAFLPGAGDQVDNHTLLDHQCPHTFSDENYKGILFKDAQGIFNGRIHVHQAAQQTNAFLNNGNLLLDDSAMINTKPELEIYADDVKCSHGSATGDLDEEALFYLRSRGIGENEARALLIHAFVEEVVDKISNKAVQTYIRRKIDDRLLDMN
jgi:Fe-S cluster assembly protein SufD